MPLANIRTPFAARRRRTACPLSSMVVTSRTRCAAFPSLMVCSQQVSSTSTHADEISPETVRRTRCSPNSLSIRNTVSLLHRGFHSRFDRISWLTPAAFARNRRHPTWQGPNTGVLEQRAASNDIARGPNRQNGSKRLSGQVFLAAHRCDDATESYLRMPRSGASRRRMVSQPQ